MTPTDPTEVLMLINQLDSRKAKGIFGVSAKFVKILGGDLSFILTKIFDESFEKGVFPDLMKNAMVTPIYKGGSKLELKNYRPVSVLPILSKILEKWESKRDLIESNDLLPYFFENWLTFKNKLIP